MEKSPKRYFRFGFPVLDGHKRRKPLPHQIRDGEAYIELMPVFEKLGWTFGGHILNYPVKSQNLSGTPPVLGAGDVVVITTRPPISEEEDRARKKIPRMNGELENQIIDALKTVFRKCSRKCVCFNKKIIAMDRDKFKKRSKLSFYEYAYDAPYDDEMMLLLKKPSNGLKSTGFFYVHLPPADNRGYEIIAAFGMSGLQTLVWSYLLRTKMAGEIDFYQPMFMMVDAEFGVIQKSPQTLAFCDTLKLTNKIDIKL
jgi:hypothetical protein